MPRSILLPDTEGIAPIRYRQQTEAMRRFQEAQTIEVPNKDVLAAIQEAEGLIRVLWRSCMGCGLQRPLPLKVGRALQSAYGTLRDHDLATQKARIAVAIVEIAESPLLADPAIRGTIIEAQTFLALH